MSFELPFLTVTQSEGCESLAELLIRKPDFLLPFSLILIHSLKLDLVFSKYLLLTIK